jgi:riboflavin kinase/FMN adenylyltransferase
VVVEFVDRLRGMVAFGSIEALVDQMHADVDRARDLLTGS